MSVKSIIVDDEPIARSIIKKFLSEEEEIEIIGECGNGIDAVKMILEEKPDIVFLDIQMPEMTGFEVIEEIGYANLPHIIFVTAYDQYAIKAFEINALDYLLKPFDKDRFHNSIVRAKELIGSKNELKEHIKDLIGSINQEAKYLNRILIKSSGRVYFLKTSEISYIEAAAYYVKLHSGKKEHVIRETLNNLESKLDPEVFVRIHRSHIVNIDYIKELEPWFNNKYLVIMKDGAKLNLSRNFRERLFGLFDTSKKSK